MRIDKFLKVSRIIKRRTVCKDLAEGGRVWINGNTAKPSSEVNKGDIVKIKLIDRVLILKVNSIQDFASKEQAGAMFEVIEEIFDKQD